MKVISRNSFQDNSIKVGLALLSLSFLFFACTVNAYTIDFDFFSGTFFFNYLLTVIYCIVVFIENKKDTGRYFRFNNFSRNVILLQLFNISAYSLNRSITVFNISTNWVLVFLVLSNILILVHVLFRDIKNTWLNHLIVIVANIGILFHLYESIYVWSAYPIAFMAFWFFGIALHAFVPLLFFWAHIKVVRHFLHKSPKYWTSTLATWVLTLFFCKLRKYSLSSGEQNGKAVLSSNATTLSG